MVEGYFVCCYSCLTAAAVTAHQVAADLVVLEIAFFDLAH